jgi:hypothetical protein
MEVHVKNSVQALSIAGLVITMAFGAFSIVELKGQQASQVTGDFRNAAMAEIRDAQGQVLLSGTFAPVDADDRGEVERLAKLSAANTSIKATGEAEVEYQTETPTDQEVEFAAEGIAAGTDVTFVIDGTTVGTAKANSKGKVEIEIAVKSQ